MKLPITIDPEIMSGKPVFTGTRVPVDTLMGYLLDGNTLENHCCTRQPLENFL